MNLEAKESSASCLLRRASGHLSGFSIFHPRFAMPVFALLLFFGAMFWAKSRDPFKRIWFSIRTPDYGIVKGVAVLPKPFGAHPVIVYLHGLRETVMSDGNTLRQFAELGTAAVSFEYDQTNQGAFDEEFVGVQKYLQQQPWATANTVGWIGLSLGAQKTLRFVLTHRDLQPQVLVRASGGWVEDLDDEAKVQDLNLKGPVLLVHGEKDQIFPASDARRLKGLLQTNGTLVDLKILSASGHTFEPDRALVMRLIGEYCKAKLTPDYPLPEHPRLHELPFWVCLMPAFAYAGFWFWARSGLCDAKLGVRGAELGNEEKRLDYQIGGRRTGWERTLRWFTAGLATLAIGDVAVHLIPPQLQVSGANLNIARKWLVPSIWKGDFENLATKPIWKGQQLKTLLEHVELAHYTANELVNWKVDDQIYKDYVLSPVIAGQAKVQDSNSKVGGEQKEELGWRRPLWESFYPRVRHEQAPAAAAEIVARYLRERVTVVSGYAPATGIETIWRTAITDESGFEMIYVAALRSVGIGARLGANGKAECWTGEKWSAAPRPISSSFL